MQIRRGVIQKAKKVVIYGPEGIGKSTLASRFPDPVFIDTEGSTDHMDVARFDKPSSWTMLMQEIEFVKKNPSCCRTLVIDTADWAERLCIDDICQKKRVDGIESIGYGKGYVFIKEAFGKMLDLLTDLTELGINVVITAHAQMRKFEQPDELGAYDRWELKLSKQCAPIVKEWADMVLFCNYKTIVVNVDGQGAQKGKNKVQGGRRVMYAVHHSCWDAKNRFGLPEELSMDFKEIAHLFVSTNTAAETQQEATKNAAKTQRKPETEPIIPPDEVFHGVSKAEENEVPFKEDSRAKPETKPQGKPKEKPGKEPEEEPEQMNLGITSPPPDESMASFYISDPQRLPKSLRDLMEKDKVTEMDIQDVVASRGYYPQDTRLQDMDASFLEGWAVAYWPQVVAAVKDIRENGFKFI